MGKRFGFEVPGWARKALEAVPSPPVPATGQWEMSLAGFLRLRTDLPSAALKPLGLLDRYGAIGFGPETVGFDGEDIPWGRVVRIVARDVVEVVTGSAMEREAEHIRGLLPPLPGRKWVVEQAMGLLGSVAGPVLVKAAVGDVVCEIVYRGKFGREKVLPAGLFPALLQAARPDVVRSLVATAREREVEVMGLRSVRVEHASVGASAGGSDREGFDDDESDRDGPDREPVGGSAGGPGLVARPTGPPAGSPAGLLSPSPASTPDAPPPPRPPRQRSDPS